MMCDANPVYANFTTNDNGKKVLFLQLKKALYGCVKSALLWYRLFRDTLQDLGFVLNPYDPCVANANIKGSQCTIVWYVDDNKISHKDPKVVADLVQRIEAKFGHMMKTQGDEHEFLGMKLQFDRQNKSVKVFMQSYINEAIQQSQLDVRRAAATPATKTLFDIDHNAAKLSPEEFEHFRSVVCKLLYVALRGRPDILLSVVFLASRVSKATFQDQTKLKRLLEYLYGTYDLPLILGADDIQTMYTFVDAAFAVHDDMKSHTGGVITFGRSGIACKSAKQKVVTKSSTEAELVGAREYPFGFSIFYKLKVSPTEKVISNKITKVLCGSHATDGHRPVNNPGILTSVIFLSRIVSTLTTSPFDTVKRNICLPIFSRNHYKAVFFVSFATSFWASPTSPPCGSPGRGACCRVRGRTKHKHPRVPLGSRQQQFVPIRADLDQQ